MAEPITRFAQWPRPVRQLLRPLAMSADGMSVQQRFLEVISRNIANAEVTRTPDGGPYQRQVAVVDADPATGAPRMQVVEDSRPGRQIYDPGHPDANDEGFVRYPNVNTTDEMIDLMVARRVHEANVSVFQAAKHMLRRALEI